MRQVIKQKVHSALCNTEQVDKFNKAMYDVCWLDGTLKLKNKLPTTMPTKCNGRIMATSSHLPCVFKVTSTSPLERSMTMQCKTSSRRITLCQWWSRKILNMDWWRPSWDLSTMCPHLWVKTLPRRRLVQPKLAVQSDSLTLQEPLSSKKEPRIDLLSSHSTPTTSKKCAIPQ